MNNKLDLVRKTRESLECLYSLYDGNIGGGDLIIIDELDGILYKGKKYHFDQDLISFKNQEGFIKINGNPEDDKTLYESSITLSKTEEVSFNNLEENSEEYLYLSELDKNINNLVSKENIKKL